MENNNCRIIIGTHLYSRSINGFNCLEASFNKDIIIKAADMSMTYLVPSLKNQTDSNFEHFTIIHNKAPKNILQVYADKLDSINFKTTLIRYNDWEPFLKESIKDCGYNVVISRIDYDDCVHKKAIETIKNKIQANKTIIYGWTNGLRYRLNSGCIREYIPRYELQGHMSILQSCLIGHNSIEYPIIFNPYKWDHSNVKKFLLENDISEQEISNIILNGNADLNYEPAYIWIRHKDAACTMINASFDKDHLYKNVSSQINDSFINDRFGISLIGK